jgi:hypothetical protein
LRWVWTSFSLLLWIIHSLVPYYWSIWFAELSSLITCVPFQVPLAGTGPWLPVRFLCKAVPKHRERVQSLGEKRSLLQFLDIYYEILRGLKLWDF